MQRCFFSSSSTMSKSNENLIYLLPVGSYQNIKDFMSLLAYETTIKGIEFVNASASITVHYNEIVFIIRDPIRENTINKPLTKKWLKNVDAIIFISPSNRQINDTMENHTRGTLITSYQPNSSTLDCLDFMLEFKKTYGLKR